MAQMRLIFTDCRVHQLSVPIAAICVLCGQIFMFMFVVSGNSTIRIFLLRDGGGGVLVLRFPFYSPLRSLSRVASDYSSVSVVCLGSSASSAVFA